MKALTNIKGGDKKVIFCLRPAPLICITRIYLKVIHGFIIVFFKHMLLCYERDYAVCLVALCRILFIIHLRALIIREAWAYENKLSYNKLKGLNINNLADKTYITTKVKLQQQNYFKTCDVRDVGILIQKKIMVVGLF